MECRASWWNFGIFTLLYRARETNNSRIVHNVNLGFLLLVLLLLLLLLCVTIQFLSFFRHITYSSRWEEGMVKIHLK